MALDVTPSLAAKPRKHLEPILLVTHGLTGGSHESYVRAALHKLTASTSAGGLSLRAVVMNLRGCNRSPVTSAMLYHVSIIQHYDLEDCFSSLTYTHVGRNHGRHPTRHLVDITKLSPFADIRTWLVDNTYVPTFTYRSHFVRVLAWS